EALRKRIGFRCNRGHSAGQGPNPLRASNSAPQWGRTCIGRATSPRAAGPPARSSLSLIVTDRARLSRAVTEVGCRFVAPSLPVRSRLEGGSFVPSLRFGKPFDAG